MLYSKKLYDGSTISESLVLSTCVLLILYMQLTNGTQFLNINLLLYLYLEDTPLTLLVSLRTMHGLLKLQKYDLKNEVLMRFMY